MKSYYLSDMTWLRLVDANFNRAIEGIRVLEDLARFVYSRGDICKELKKIRHAFSQIPGKLALQSGITAISRRSATDVGRNITTSSERSRGDWEDILTANAKRVGESARVLQESVKLVNPAIARQIKELRYVLYDIEGELNLGNMIQKKLAFDLYAVTNRAAQKGRSHLQVVRDAIRGGAKAIQLRDKDAKLGEYFQSAKAIAGLCKKHGVAFIVNDYIDICRAVDADGVHMGQEDLPVTVARRVLGPDKILGYSTHDPREAKEAERGGADYVSVGPIFETPSKEGWKPRGLGFVRWAAKNLSIPFVAIGGIDTYNVEQVVRAGAQRVAVIRAAVGAPDIARAVRGLRREIKRATSH